MSVDLEKAFDSVSIPYLQTVLQRTSFGPGFLNAKEALYCNPLAKIRANDLFSESFLLLRDTRQGCPLSPLLFPLAIEPLARYIRQETQISGAIMGTREHKISFYADNIVLYLTSVPKSLKRFSRFSLHLQRPQDFELI